MRATRTEQYLKDKDLADVRVLQQALKYLHDDLEPETSPTEAPPETKRALAVGLLYKVGEASEGTMFCYPTGCS